MGEREMFLVIGAIIFFTITSLSVNQFCVNHSEVMMQSEFDYYAISLAQRVIEEAKTRAFDSAVAFGTSTNPPYDFTGPGSLGHLNNESFNWEEENKLPFNDIDDYNNINDDVSTPRGDYHVSATVYYVEESNPDVKVYHRTFYKKMIVTVTSDYISNPITLSHVYCYYDFD